MRMIGGFFALFVLIIAFAAQSGFHAIAQEQMAWSIKEIPLNNELTDGVPAVSMPSLVTDQTEWVHLFWPEDAPGLSPTLFHVQTRGDKWQMNDVLLLHGLSRAHVAVDTKNNLHAVWLEPGAIYHTTAPAPQSLDPLAWTKPEIIMEGDLASPTLAIDGDDRIHLLYADREKLTSIRYISSLNGGRSWSNPKELFVAPSSELVADLPQLAIAENGELHAVWSMLQEPEMYGGRGVYYAHSFDHGTTWSQPLRLDRMSEQEPEDLAWLASIAVRNGSEVHAVWDAHAYSGQRRHRWSSDAGATWSEIQPIMGGLMAQTGINPMIADSSDTLYLFGAGTFEWGTRPGVYYSVWNGNNWIPPQAVTLSDGDPHYLAVSVSEGNLLHVAWTTGGIGYATARTTAPGKPLPAGEIEAFPQVRRNTASTILTATAAAPIPIPTRLPDKLVLPEAPMPSSAFDANLRLAGFVMPALILTLAVVMMQLNRQRK